MKVKAKGVMMMTHLDKDKLFPSIVSEREAKQAPETETISQGPSHAGGAKYVSIYCVHACVRYLCLCGHSSHNIIFVTPLPSSLS